MSEVSLAYYHNKWKRGAEPFYRSSIQIIPVDFEVLLDQKVRLEGWKKGLYFDSGEITVKSIDKKVIRNSRLTKEQIIISLRVN